MNHEHDNPDIRPASPLPRAVPRVGLGHEDAWQAYKNESEHSTAENEDGNRINEDGNRIEGDNSLHDGPSSPQTTRDASLESTVPPLDLSGAQADRSAWPDPAMVPELAPLATASNGSAPPPPDDIYPDEREDEPESAPDPNAPRGEEQDIWSHLGELRLRILHSIAGVLVASMATWHFGQQISDFFARPIRESLKADSISGNLVTLDPTEGFLVYFQITIVAAILLSSPWILYQMWRFLEPALTRTERRFTLILLPFSVLLFFSGCALGYAMSPLFFKFFVAFQPPGTIANFGFSRSIALLAKMVLVFGVCFQVPVIIILLNKIGLISRNLLIEYWRHAVVVIFIIVAILTPTWDPLSLFACAVPPCLLYGLSIWMVKWL